MKQPLIGAVIACIALTSQVHAASLDSCVASIRKQAINAGVKKSVANKALTNVKYDEKAVRFSRSQPEYKTPVWDYMAFLVDPDRIKTGKAMLRKHSRTLRAIEKSYGIDRHVIVAFWGIESNYGKDKGDFFIPHALANVACAGKRPKFFRQQIVASLLLVSQGHLKLDDLYGSWAGAFGHTQFIPTTYRSLAVDFDKNGRRDLVNSVPDALGSTANYLKKNGWRRGGDWGYEVRVPKGYKGPSGRKAKASLSTWAKRGVRRLDGKRPSGKTTAALMLPAGRNGPAFLVLHNFHVIRTYNSNDAYAIAISHLSDRLRGGGPIKTAWPTNDPGLTRQQRLELQILLLRAGYDIGEADGKIGPVTRAAIREAEKKFGMPVTGRPGMKIFKALGG